MMKADKFQDKQLQIILGYIEKNPRNLDPIGSSFYIHIYI